MIYLEEKIEKNLCGSDLAVINNNVSYSYQEFGNAVLSFKEYYTANQIQRVMICLPQSFLAYAAIIAAYLAHTTFCPIDVDAPLLRKKYFIDTYMPELILTEANMDIPVSTNIEIIDVDAFWNEYRNVASKNSDCKKDGLIQVNNIAYVIFTSGSTGVPKGVMVSRTVLENFVEFGLKEYSITNNDIWGQFSKLSFDLSTFDIFVAIAGGATLVPIATKGSKLLPARMIDKYKITYWHSVPSVIDLINFNALSANSLQSLRIMNFAGEALYPETVRRLFEKNSKMAIYNVFGHTETTFAMYQKLNIDNYQDFFESTVSIGETIPNYTVTLQNVAEGIGEIVISGLIAEGYIGEEHSDAFICQEINGKVQKSFVSGDYGYYSNGHLYFWGRTDTQIKHRGNRIDLNEIDNAFRSFGYFSKTLYFEGQILSFITTTNNEVDVIMDQLRTVLPDYYIPQKIYELQQMPINSSNKIDKNSLLKILQETRDSASK